MCFYTIRHYAACGHSREDVWLTCENPDHCTPIERPPPEEAGARSPPQRGVCPDCEERLSGQRGPPQLGRSRRRSQVRFDVPAEDDVDERMGRRTPDLRSPRGPGGLFQPDEDFVPGLGAGRNMRPPARPSQRPNFNGGYDDGFGDGRVYRDYDRGPTSPGADRPRRRRTRRIREGYYRVDRDGSSRDVLDTTNGYRYVQVRPRRRRHEKPHHEVALCCVQ